MGKRRRSRELALQALYYMDMRQDLSQELLDRYCQCFPPPKQALPFFRKLVQGVIESHAQIDAAMVKFSSHWKIGRMSCVDRNIMRIAAFEMLFCDDIPAKVSINEAIDVGKKFGTEETGAFVNGILDSLRLALANGDIAMSPPTDGERSEVEPVPVPAVPAEPTLPPPEPEISRTQVNGGVLRRRRRPVRDQSEDPICDPSGQGEEP